jgi:carbon-monoxide dehydrogenase medium subunit
MKPARFDYLAVESADEAVAVLARFDGHARCLAGGQSLVPLLNMRLVRPAAIVDINRVPGLDGIDGTAPEDGARDVVRLGALVRYTALEHSPLVHERLPLLARAVPLVGDRQVRNRGTLGGALCHADPSGEMALVAVTTGATLHVVGPDGARDVAAVDFLLGPYATALGPADVLVGVSLPDHAAARAVVVEHTRRHGDFAVVSVAAVAEPAPDGTWRHVRLGLGGVSARPVLARRAASLLDGTRLEPDAVRGAGEAALAECDPGSDIRASAEYRRHLVPIYVERALGALREASAPRIRRAAGR